MLQKISELIRKKTPTAAELRTAIEGISVAELNQAVDALEARRRVALLDGSDDVVAAIERELELANRQVERAHAAIEELTKRIGDAQARELEAEVVRRRVAATDAQKNGLRALVEIDECALRLVDQIRRFDEATKAVQRENEFLRENSVVTTDTKIKLPLSALAEHLGRQLASPLCAAVAGVTNPGEFRMPGYLPRHPDGGLFGRAKELL